MDSLKVLFLASEADPLVKVGGLGDVAGSLPQALLSMGHSPDSLGVDIRLVLPFHPQLNRDRVPIQKIASFIVESLEGLVPVEAFVVDRSMEDWTVPTYLIDGPPIQDSPDVYSDDAMVDGRKYVYFSLAALKLIEALEWWPDIIHANDWHTAAAVYKLSDLAADDERYRNMRSLLTIHNLPYTGAGSEGAMELFGLPPSDDPHLPWWARHQPLPLGLVAADRVVAVSPGYAQEICTPEYGAGLDGLLRARGKAITGILNGIDTNLWDPECDPEIRMQYSIASLPARMRNKSELQSELELPITKSTLLLASISRMVHQKGVDLIIEALYNLDGYDWQALILGTGEPLLEEAALTLQSRFPDRVRAAITYDPRFSRRVFAGADAIMIPSRYEPSGLTQMIGMRYGCVPIARSTGGLADSIQDYRSSEEGTGFLFEEADSTALSNAIVDAMAVYPDKRRWQGIQRRGMKGDYSWDRSAEEYFALYKEMIRN